MNKVMNENKKVPIIFDLLTLQKVSHLDELFVLSIARSFPIIKHSGTRV